MKYKQKQYLDYIFFFILIWFFDHFDCIAVESRLRVQREGANLAKSLNLLPFPSFWKTFFVVSRDWVSNLAVGVNRKISAASARTHTRKSRQTSFRLPSGWFSLVFYLFILFLLFLFLDLFLL